jgi:hypothetical protein
MSEVNNYISNGINAVFSQSSEDLTIANGYLSKYSDQTYLLINNLNGLCGCDFIAEAQLQNIIPSKSITNTIYLSFDTSGEDIPPSIILLNQAFTLGTSGKFYSCVSADDPNPILVATGSNTFAGYQLAQKQCNDWAMKGITLTDGIYEMPSRNLPYFSVTGEAPCYQFYEFSFTPIGYGYGICMYALDNELPS